MQARCLMLAAAVAGASAVDSAYNPDVMSNEDRMYQLGLWSSVLIILAFFSAVKMVCAESSALFHFLHTQIHRLAALTTRTTS